MFTGVDCSGLVYLCCRVLGMHVPRLCQGLLHASKPIEAGIQLQPGDCLFLVWAEKEKNIPYHSHHVMLVVDVQQDLIFESNGLGGMAPDDWDDPSKACCRFIKSTDHVALKVPLASLANWQKSPREQEFICMGSLF